jgi:hypothetical protein
MKMGDRYHENETFTEFIARFRSKAVLGKVSQGDWTYQLWAKITDRLRNSTSSVKNTWNNDFNTMVVSLTSTDLENRRNYDRTKQHAGPKNTPKPAATSSGTTYKATPKPFRPFLSPGPSMAPKATTDRPKFSTSPIPPPPTKTPASKDTCYLCGQVGHYKAQCPQLPKIRAIIAEIDGVHETNDSDHEEEVEPDAVREGNEDA